MPSSLFFCAALGFFVAWSCAVRAVHLRFGLWQILAGLGFFALDLLGVGKSYSTGSRDPASRGRGG